NIRGRGRGAGRGGGGALGAADLLDSLVGPPLEPAVAGMARLLVGVVVPGVVAADERPAGLIAAVLVGAVEGIAVEEQGIAGRHPRPGRVPAAGGGRPRAGGRRRSGRRSGRG